MMLQRKGGSALNKKLCHPGIYLNKPKIHEMASIVNYSSIFLPPYLQPGAFWFSYVASFIFAPEFYTLQFLRLCDIFARTKLNCANPFEFSSSAWNCSYFHIGFIISV